MYKLNFNITCYLIILYLEWSLGTVGESRGTNKGIIAFNCSHEDSISSEFGLLHCGACPDFSVGHTLRERETTLQLLQRKEFSSIHGYGAKVVRTLSIQPCSGTPATKMFTQRVLELTQKEVTGMYKTGLWGDKYLLDLHAPLGDLNYNGTTYLARNLIGWTDEHGGKSLNSTQCSSLPY